MSNKARNPTRSLNKEGNEETKKKRINQIEDFTVKIVFSNSGHSLDHLIDAYIKAKLFMAEN